MATDAALVRVVLVDDHPMVRQGLSAFLRSEGFEVVAAASGAKEGLDALSNSLAEILVVDLTLEQGSGQDVLRAVTRLHPSVKNVVYSVHEDGDKVREAMQAGAMGYVTKREDPDILLDALRQVHSGQRFLSPRAARAMANVLADQPPADPRTLLSPQELEVFVLTGKGNAPQDVAVQMHLSVRTVETYFVRVMDKLGIQGRRPLRLFATEWVRHQHETP